MRWALVNHMAHLGRLRQWAASTAAFVAARHEALPLRTLAAAPHATVQTCAVAAAPATSFVRDSLLLPALSAMATLLPGLMPSLLLTGKSKWSGKNKRHPKAANHGSRPASHIGRRQRAAAKGRYQYQPKR
jgi:hypothetical protein